MTNFAELIHNNYDNIMKEILDNKKRAISGSFGKGEVSLWIDSDMNFYTFWNDAHNCFQFDKEICKIYHFENEPLVIDDETFLIELIKLFEKYTKININFDKCFSNFKTTDKINVINSILDSYDFGCRSKSIKIMVYYSCVENEFKKNYNSIIFDLKERENSLL